MKVSISYTVDMDEVPMEVDKFLTQCHELTNNLSFDKIYNHMEDEHFDKVITEISFLRKKLSDIDYRLEDSLSILSGYQRARHTPPDTPAPTPVSEPPPKQQPTYSGLDLDNARATSDTIQKQLADLKKTSPQLFPKSSPGGVK